MAGMKCINREDPKHLLKMTSSGTSKSCKENAKLISSTEAEAASDDDATWALPLMVINCQEMSLGKHSSETSYWWWLSSCWLALIGSKIQSCTLQKSPVCMQLKNQLPTTLGLMTNRASPGTCQGLTNDPGWKQETRTHDKENIGSIEANFFVGLMRRTTQPGSIFFS